MKHESHCSSCFSLFFYSNNVLCISSWPVHRCCGIVCTCSYTLVLRESGHSSVLVCPFTLVSGILGQSHIHLRLELITQVTVLLGKGGGQDHYRQINTKVLQTDPVSPVMKRFPPDADNPNHRVQGLTEWFEWSMKMYTTGQRFVDS